VLINASVVIEVVFTESENTQKAENEADMAVLTKKKHLCE
jgi:hypothetical protein